MQHMQLKPAKVKVQKSTGALIKTVCSSQVPLKCEHLNKSKCFVSSLVCSIKAAHQCECFHK